MRTLARSGRGVTTGPGYIQAFLQQAQAAQETGVGVGAVAGATTAGAFGAVGRFQYCGPGPAERRAALPVRSPARRMKREVFMAIRVFWLEERRRMRSFPGTKRARAKSPEIFRGIFRPEGYSP